MGKANIARYRHIRRFCPRHVETCDSRASLQRCSAHSPPYTAKAHSALSRSLQHQRASIFAAYCVVHLAPRFQDSKHYPCCTRKTRVQWVQARAWFLFLPSFSKFRFLWQQLEPISPLNSDFWAVSPLGFHRVSARKPVCRTVSRTVLSSGPWFNNHACAHWAS